MADQPALAGVERVEIPTDEVGDEVNKVDETDKVDETGNKVVDLHGGAPF